MQASKASAHTTSLLCSLLFSSGSVAIFAKFGMSFEYQNAGSMAACCQSMIPVITDGSSFETNISSVLKDGWNSVGVAAFWTRGSDAISLTTGRACLRSSMCSSMVPWYIGRFLRSSSSETREKPASTNPSQYA